MAHTPKQLVFDLPHRPAQGVEDFIVTGSNSAAVAMIDAWPNWPQAAAAVIGPHQSGKSHLTAVWCTNAKASAVSASALNDEDLARAEVAGGLAIEDIDRGIANEQLLFHILNLSRQTKLYVLLTSTLPPGEIAAITLPDLRSRLRALSVAIIEPPDEALLKVLLVKLFSDRQLSIEPPAVNYLARHLDRSWHAAAQVVEKVDELALATHRRVTRSLAAQALQFINHDEPN